MTPRWLAMFAALPLIASIAIQESRPKGGELHPPPDEQAAPEPGAEPQPPMQRFQMDPNFNSIEISPPPPSAPGDGTITPPPPLTPAKKPQTLAPPPTEQGPPQ